MDFIREATDAGDILSIPKRFKTYDVERTIGTGSYSVVVEIRDMNNRQYAAKVMRRPKANTEDMRLMERELRLGESITCPYLVSCIEVVYMEELIVLVMEKGSGKDLLAMINENPNAVSANWRNIFRQICFGVQYLHRKGLAHRDLKLENVLIDENFNCKVCDYGLMCQVQKSDLASTKCGTLPYMSPEMIHSANYSGQAADMWALGIILYVVATSSLPWRSVNQLAMCKEIQGGITDLETVPTQQREIVAQCCHLDPERRSTIEHVLSLSFIRVTSIPPRLKMPMVNVSVSRGSETGRSMITRVSCMRACRSVLKPTVSVLKNAAAARLVPIPHRRTAAE